MREQFIERKFKDETLETIVKANAIIAEYLNQGFQLTLRQLYYQFVARGMIANKQSEYKRLGSIINDGRLAGLIDWDAIEDRTRALERLSTWRTPTSYIMPGGYREDLWASQRYRPEVWVEKEALVGVFEGICNELHVPFMACRGYASQTLLYDAGKRMARHWSNGYRPVILHFGDHDPSGIDMSRDNQERVTMFARRFNVDLRRLALNQDQIDKYNPPPNPAKETDARFVTYFQTHGSESWELDALEPTLLAELVRNEVGALRDNVVWEKAEEAQEHNRWLLEQIVKRWGDVVEMLEEDRR